MLHETHSGLFELTPISETLRADVPGSLRAFTIFQMSHNPIWAEFIHTVKTGEVAFDHTYGISLWEWLGEKPQLGTTFNQAMTDMTSLVHESVVESYDFSRFKRIVDVAGGQGRFMVSILKSAPNISGVVFDRPEVVDGAVERMRDEGLSSRCEVIGGNYLESVPEGADGYVLKWVIHDSNDDSALALFRRIWRAMAPGGTLLIVENVVPGPNIPSFSKLMDLNTMALTGGRERTQEDYRALYTKAGFTFDGITVTEAQVSIIQDHK